MVERINRLYIIKTKHTPEVVLGVNEEKASMRKVCQWRFDSGGGCAMFIKAAAITMSHEAGKTIETASGAFDSGQAKVVVF